jgi:cell division septation protein DedD
VITKRIAENLELDFNEPYVDIVLISKNSTFIAKKAKTFEEEKNVAEKAPIDGIQISNLNNDEKNENKIQKNDKFSYSIKVADFYYKKTAQNMIDRIKSETSLKYLKIIKLSKNKYRVLIGPFNDIKSLKESFEKMNSLLFENLEIINNV